MRVELGIASLALLCSFDPCAFAAQDPEPSEGPTPIEIPVATSEAQEEMLQLFRDIEENLRIVDVLLSDAGAGDTSTLEDVKEAGIGRLLENSRTTSQQILTDIDRLLEIAQEMGQQSSSGSGQSQSESESQSQNSSQGSSAGSDPLNRGSQSTQREQTPEGPGQSPAGQEPQNGEQPGGEQPDNAEHPPGAQGQQPSDGQESPNTEPENRPGALPPTDPTDIGSAANAARDRWGDLPVHYQDVFRGEDSGELPVRYREWIDAYYRRLNQRGGR